MFNEDRWGLKQRWRKGGMLLTWLHKNLIDGWHFAFGLTDKNVTITAHMLTSGVLVTFFSLLSYIRFS